MTYYEPLDPVLVTKLLIYWGSWLAFPYLAWLSFRIFRNWSGWDGLSKITATIFLAGGLIFIDARFIEPQLLHTRTTVLNLGFKAKIALISDIHLGIYKSPSYLKKVVARLNELDVDAVLIAGDLTYHPDRPIEELLAPLRHSRHVILAVLGNHDEERPGPPVQNAIKSALAKHGAILLEGRSLDIKGYAVAGLGDMWAGKDDFSSLPKRDKTRSLIALMHNPDTAMKFSHGDVALAVAGHTHGGQIRLPYLYKKVIPTQYPFDSGLHGFTPVPVYVSSGLGEISLPMRFLNPPVIDVLHIR